MLRALFLQELRRSWLAHAGLFVAAFLTITLVERATTRASPPSSDDASSLAILLSAGILLSGLISGERCFPAAFKEGRYAFLLTLPRPRGGIWLAYLGGRLVGVLAALPALLLAGPSLLFRWWASRDWPFLIAAFSVYLVFFLGSATLALAFRKELLVYLVGPPLLTGLIAFLAYNASYGYFLIEPSDLEEPSRYLGTLSWGSLPLALTWAAVSLRAFCRGEIHLGRRTARTLAEAGLASASILGLAIAAFSSSNLAAVGKNWVPAEPYPFWLLYQADSRPISADGRFLFIQQQIRERPLFKRLAVVDLESASTTRWMERPDIYQSSWSASEAVLNVLAANGTPAACLGLRCQHSTSWYRLSPDLHVLSIQNFPGTGLLRQLGSDLLLVTREGTTGRIYRLSDRDGSFSEILTAESESDPDAWSLDRGAIAVFFTSSSLRAWWLDLHGRVLHEESVPRFHQETYSFTGQRILSSQEVRAEVIQRAPPPSENSEDWEPLFQNVDGPLDFGSNQFYLERGQGMAAIWKYDVQRRTWSRLLSEIQLAEARLVLNVLSEDTGPTRFDVDYRTWTWAAIVASQGRQRLFLYDDRLGESIPNTLACGPGEEGRTSLQRIQGLEGLLVRFICRDPTGLKRYRLLEIVPGSGRVRELPLHATFEQSEHFSQWIYLDPEGASVWVSRTGEVWQKHRRLNPPAE